MIKEDLRDIFMDYFIKIENELGKFSKPGEISFSTKLRDASNRSPKIKNFNREIRAFEDLRNVYSHNTKRDLAIPHKDAITDIKKLYEEIINPRKAYDIAHKELSTFKINDYLDTVLEEVRTKNYSQFPILNDDGNFEALLTENGIVQWLAKKAKEEVIAIDETIIEELLVGDEKSQNYRFVSKNRDIYFIGDLFQRHTIEAVFVTETGKMKEKIIGIITIWDVKEIN